MGIEKIERWLMDERRQITKPTPREELRSALDRLLENEYARGLKDGLDGLEWITLIALEKTKPRMAAKQLQDMARTRLETAIRKWEEKRSDK